MPPRSLIMQATRRKMFFTEDYQPLIKANSRGKLRQPGTKVLSKMVQDAGLKHGSSSAESPNNTITDFLDFLDKVLEWKPDRRMTPSEGFQHPWIKAGIQELKNKVSSGGNANASF